MIQRDPKNRHKRNAPPRGVRILRMVAILAVSLAAPVSAFGAAAASAEDATPTNPGATGAEGQALADSASTGAAQSERATEEALIEDEITVIGERTPLTLEERVKIYRELARARELYSSNKIDEAFPLLLKTARKGFKNAQARVGHIYLRGLGEIEQDPVEALGWLGVASSGTTSPPIRNYFNDMWKRLPDRYVPHLEEVVEEFRTKYGEGVTGVVCELHRPARTYVKQLVCYFEQDLPDMVKEPLDDHFTADERQRMIEQNQRRIQESIQTRRQLPTASQPF